MPEFLRKRAVFFLPGLVVLVGLGVYLYQTFQPEPIPAFRVKTEDVLATLTVTGEVKADVTVNVTAPFQARIARILTDEGLSVTTGQALVTLVSDENQAALSEANAVLHQRQAALDFLKQGTRQEELSRLRAAVTEAGQRVRSAAAEYDQADRYVRRLEPLQNDGAISVNDYDEALTKKRGAEAALEAAKARLAQAEEDLGKGVTWPTPPETRESQAAVSAAQKRIAVLAAQFSDRLIKSPIDGVVLERLQSPGDVVLPSNPILKIADRRTLEIVGYVEEADLSRVSVGDPCYVILDALPEQALPGTVREIGAEVNPANGTVEVKVHLDNSGKKPPTVQLLPGMTADISIVTDALSNAIVIPTTAVIRQDDRFQVFVIRQGTLRMQPVAVRQVSLEYFQVMEGLQPGDWVARAASLDLLEKRRVKVVETSPDYIKPWTKEAKTQ